MNYKSTHDLSINLINNLHIFPHDIDLVVGVPRSGLLVANMIALLMNLQITDVDGLLSDRIIGSGTTKQKFLHGVKHHISDCNKILVVEDTVYTGLSLLSTKKRIEDAGLSSKVVYFAAYILPGKESLVDFYLDTLPMPRAFEWNLFHCGLLGNSCVDIDGVLCVDPTEEENDDGERYRVFLEHASPKIIPTRKIKYIVSSRLEKYRPETEKWLDKNHVDYDQLFMLDSTARERREKGLHVAFKSKIYQDSNCGLFIESSVSQALKIHDSTGKPVYCVENNTLYDETTTISPQNGSVVKKTNRFRAFFSRIPVLKVLYRRLKRFFGKKKYY